MTPRRPLRVLLALALLLSLGGGGARAQGGRAEIIDFPDRWQHAADVQPGAYEGAFGGADREDWVRVVPVPGHAVRATLRYPGAIGASLALLDDAGRLAERTFRWSDDGTHVTLVSQGLPSPGGGVRVGAKTSASATHPYTLTVESVPVPDGAVLGVRVRAVQEQGPMGNQESATRRIVEVDVANFGEAPLMGGAVTVTLSSRPTGPTATLTLPFGVLARDERRTLAAEWRVAGVGSVGIHAVVTLAQDVDKDPRNDQFRGNAVLLASLTVAGVVAPPLP